MKDILAQVNEMTRMNESREYFNSLAEHLVWETTVC